MKTKTNTAQALAYIHKAGLENSQWNIETTERTQAYYGVTGHLSEAPMAPHVALFYDIEADQATNELYAKSDYSINSNELGLIFIYEL